MFKLKALAAGAAGALVAGLLLTPVTTAGAAPQSSSATAPAVEKKSEWADGAVRDQLGRYVDGVLVEVVPATALAATPVASALTYEAPDAGQPHGYYMLRVGRAVPAGDYRIRFSSPSDATDPFRTQYYPGTVKLKRNKAGAPVGEWLDDVTMQLQRRVGTTTAAKLRAAVVKPSQQGVVDVTVVAPELSAVEGTVEVVVKRGRKKVGTVTAKLVRRDRGALTVKLPRLDGPAKARCRVVVKNKVKKKVCAKQVRFVTYVVAVAFTGTDLASRSAASATLKVRYVR